ncbi:terpenoid synthase [Cystobasidium minutum MCA 4210]|uniref:terpenoid synthase n=1 Tax=Cystobasidium minutum MCA 4210 TaxID=1397322 RepID=UPI0034CED8A0|eukprot:jgi/Rhomi1/165158/fgenesh1_kg.1_\
MLLTYWRVHLLYTIPPTLLLFFILRPLLSRRNIFSILFHVVIATLYTFPWDSYIIKNHAWTYADWAVMFTLAKVPIEEVFFFIIQSIFTSQLYLLLGMLQTPSQHLLYLSSSHSRATARKIAYSIPLLALPAMGIAGWRAGIPETYTFYLGCILWWITPIMTFLWFIAGDHFLSRRTTSLLTIAIPTIYLCIVDTIALKAGTWHITERTSTGYFVWPDLPLEEATFFLLTNTLLTFGMSAFERCFAVIDVFGDLLASDAATSAQEKNTPTTFPVKVAPKPDSLNSVEFIKFLYKSLLLRVNSLPIAYKARITAFESTQETLSKHSKSFHTASYIFPSNVRRDLVILYAFCRVLDDFCDESESQEEAKRLIDMSKEWLDLLYSPSTPLESPSLPSSHEKQYNTNKGSTAAGSGRSTNAVHGVATSTPSNFVLSTFLHKRVPEEAQPAFYLLSTISNKIPRYPFDDLIAGYEWDLAGQSARPISTTEDLVEYSRLVASSVAEMCVWAMWANEGISPDLSEDDKKHVLQKAASMGVALQITNIARDIKEDATKGRIYIPSEWFETLPQPESMDDLISTITPPGEARELAARKQDGEYLRQCANEKTSPDPKKFRYHTYLNQLLNLAEKHTEGTSEAITRLPASCQAGIRAATGVYIAIGKEIENRAFQNAKRAVGCENLEYDGTRVSMTKGQRIRIALKEVYGL